MADSNLVGLKKNFESEQAGRSKAEASLESSLKELEKIKADFESERSAFETEKVALLKRSQDAEDQLKPVAEELTSLKRHISMMTEAIFGK